VLFDERAWGEHMGNRGLSLLAADLRDDLSRFHLLHYGGKVDGFLISGHNCGTHWLRFMLSAATAWACPGPRDRAARPAMTSSATPATRAGLPRRRGSAARTTCPRAWWLSWVRCGW
jgi:hypothetical protein